MRLIALDCEYNQPSQKTIQVGAVCFEPDKGKIVETFNYYVDPYEPLNEEIIKLTGITDEMLKKQSDIKGVASFLTMFKQKYQINSIPIVWGSGRSNDVSKIYTEAQIESPFTDRIIDVKAVYQMLANSSTSDMRAKVGLGRALELVGLDWDDKHGKPHNALADAYNTMRIYMFLSKCLKGGFETHKSIKGL